MTKQTWTIRVQPEVKANILSTYGNSSMVNEILKKHLNSGETMDDHSLMFSIQDTLEREIDSLERVLDEKRCLLETIKAKNNKYLEADALDRVEFQASVNRLTKKLQENHDKRQRIGFYPKVPIKTVKAYADAANVTVKLLLEHIPEELLSCVE